MTYEKGLIRTDRGLFIDKGNHRYDPRHPDFGGLGADPDGLKDSRPAFADCDTAASSAGAGCFAGPGTYLISSNLTLAQDWTLARGAVLKPASGVTVTFSGAVRGEGTEALTFDTSLGGSFTATNSQFGITNVSAPPDAQYLTLAANGDLSAERVLTAGDGITFTDAGAGSTLTVAQDDNSVVQKVEVAKAGTLVGTRKRINLIEGANVTLTVADDVGDDEVDVTVAAATGAPDDASYLTLGTDGALSAERVLTAGDGITLTDGGAGSTLTVAAPARAMTPIAESVLATDAATIVFTSIPATFRHLLLVVSCRTDTSAGAEGVRLRFNGDGSSIYDSQRVQAAAASVTAAEALDASSGLIGDTAALNADAGVFSNIEILIADYASANHKAAYGKSASKATGTTGGIRLMNDTVHWPDTDAVTAITLFAAGGGDFVTGSVASLYGLA